MAGHESGHLEPNRSGRSNPTSNSHTSLMPKQNMLMHVYVINAIMHSAPKIIFDHRFCSGTREEFSSHNSQEQCLDK